MGVPHKCDGCEEMKLDCIVQFYPRELWICHDCKMKIVYGIRPPKLKLPWDTPVDNLTSEELQGIA